MSRYIDADEALRMMRNSQQDNPCEQTHNGIWNTAHDCCISCLDAVPTADVVEVVRCKDCRFWEEYCVKDADEIVLLEKEFGFEIRITSACIGECHCKEWLGVNNYVSRQTGLNDYCSYGERRGK